MQYLRNVLGVVLVLVGLSVAARLREADRWSRGPRLLPVHDIQLSDVHLGEGTVTFGEGIVAVSLLVENRTPLQDLRSLTVRLTALDCPVSAPIETNIRPSMRGQVRGMATLAMPERVVGTLVWSAGLEQVRGEFR